MGALRQFELSGWQGLFWIDAAIAAGCMVLTFTTVAESRDAGRPRSVDYVGTVLVALTLGPLSVTVHIEPVIDAVRQAQEADVAAVLKGDVDGSYRVSTRSRGATDVGAACSALGGGGHRLAAGFTSHDDVETTIARLRDALACAPRPS